MAKVCLSGEIWLYIKECTIWPRCALVWRPDCISKYVRYGQGVPQYGGLIVYQSMFNMDEMCHNVEAWLYIKVSWIWTRCASVWRPDCISKYVRYWRGVPQCEDLIVYQSMNDMAEVCLSVKTWLYVKVCSIWPRCASVWRPNCISKYVRYDQGVPQCGGLIVYQSMYDMAKVCLSVEVWLYIKVCTIWPRRASVWRSDCISKYVRYGQGVPQCGGLIVYQSMYDTGEVCLSVKTWLYIKVCTIWPRCASVWRSDCISKYVRYWRGVPQCEDLIVYQSMYDMAKVCFSVKTWLYIKVCTVWPRCASVWRSDSISKYVQYGRDVSQCGGLIVYQS